MAAGPDSARQSDGLFSVRAVVGIGWVTLTSVVFCNLVIKLFDRQLLATPNVPLPRYWPISKFALRVTRLPMPDAAVFTALALVVFAVAMVVLLQSDHPTLLPVVLAGGTLLVLTTLTHGVGPGILRPLSAPGNYDRAAIGILDPGGYYLAAVDVADPIRFLETFESQQLSLPLHAQTHPPGAVLTFYVLNTLLPSALWVSIVVGVGSLALTALLLSRLLRTYSSDSVTNYTTFLFVLLPATQIYYLTSLDAMIAVAMLAAVYCFTRDSPAVAALGTLVCVFVASTQTFTFIFILPVLGVLALARREKRLPFVVVVAGLVAAYALLAVGFGFDYLHSFSLASTQQNTDGFQLFVTPLDYLYTRIEDVSEIALFFTPFLCLLAVRGTRVLWRGVRAGHRSDRDPLLLFGGAVLSLGGLFLVSVYHTGETARGALFVYPFLLLPVAAAVRAADATTRRRAILAAAVFGQALFMQLIGDYWW